MGLVVDFAGEQLHAHEGTLSNSRATSVQPFFQSLQHQDVVMTLYSFRVEAPGWSDLCDFSREASRRRSAELSSRAESEGAEAENSEAWCEPFIQGVAGAKFRCMLCSKLFRGPEFVKMHLEAKHKEEAKRIMQDKYFDCDVSREDAMPIHHAMGTQKFEMDRV
ncbi:unnamed protein product [Effrenium voratum]|uniref:C2H2-type domain-containing protein n=1 Tax=Effrenium voratum TaxID=2562239 RepID=A0AA36JRW7_9DINO|nr:unnamed protein product [Effrenium voratum]